MHLRRRLEPGALLDTAAFEPVAVLSGRERIAFLRHYFARRPTLITRLHRLGTIVLLGALALSFRTAAPCFTCILGATGAGLAITLIVVVPLHESIHAGAYRLFGAPEIRWRISLRQQIVSVTAHRFVLNRKELMWCAALPSVVLSIVLSAAIFILPSLGPALLTALLLHHLGSRGDWAYVNYCWLCGQRDIYAFEDANLGRSYFYVAVDHQPQAAR
jgi:hypothetical protein